MTLISEASVQVVLWERTLPLKDRAKEVNERKGAKYSELLEESQIDGWRAGHKPIERIQQSL